MSNKPEPSSHTPLTTDEVLVETTAGSPPTKTDRVAVITGASRGLGAELAVQLSSLGWRLILVARNRRQLAATAERCDQATIFCADVSDSALVRELADYVQAEVDNVDLLVNNAGLLGPIGFSSLDLSAELVATTIGCNVSAVIYLILGLAPLMRRGGAIVNLAGAGVGGDGLASATPTYTTSKFAVAGLTEAFAPLLQTRGISINAVSPGAVDTGFNDPILSAGPSLGKIYTQTVEQRLNPVPMDPFISLVRFLAEPENNWLTGRLLSARWDTPGSLRSQADRLEKPGSMRLRRIDSDVYARVG